MAQPQPRRTAPRAVSILSVDSATPTHFESHDTRLSPHYLLPPTIPSPFDGTLNASLEAILVFGSQYPQLFPLCKALREDVDRSTNWPRLFQECMGDGENGRILLEEFLFLVTRTLLPEQITENRALMEKMYSMKKNLSTRVVLRYDTLRKWQKRDHSHFVMVDSKPPSIPAIAPPPPVENSLYPDRRPLLPNIIPTLIAAPAGGWGPKKLVDAMRHHVTELDRFLLLKDEEIASLSGSRLLVMLSAVLMQWKWLRKNTEELAALEANAWEDMDVRADDNELVRDKGNNETGGARDK